MQACAACGSESPEGHRFCWSCGAALTAPVVERRKLVTSVFCDLSGSTAMGELADAETVFELMNSYFDAARAALERHGGTVEKFIGDAVVGMFGVPEAHEDDALRGCRAALEIQARLATSNLGIAVRIGVNTGEVVAGDAARREMFASGDAVVLGDSVNVAARLEQAAAPGEVLIGEATFGLVSDAVTTEPVEPIAAKGKFEPLIAYRLLAASTHGPLPRRVGTPLVGRQHELALLEVELEARPECRLVTIVGEAGVGKSRLVAELSARIAGRARIARGACLSYGEGITYWAIAQIVRDLAGIRDDYSAEEARSRVPPRIAQLLGLAEGTATADQTAQAVAGLLATYAAEQPLVVVVDDIHWAEPALLDLLGALPVMARDSSIVVCLLARPELLEHRPEWPVTVRLEPLGPGEVDRLLESLEAPAQTRVRLAQAASGNPLYAEELVAWVREGGDVDDLPTSLSALLGARLDRLEAGERDALERGAVEGELFHSGAVVALSDGTPVVDEFDALTRKDLIRVTAASIAGELLAYRFKHILVRDAAYRATTKKLRATLHERFADWLERRAGTRVGEYHEILGYHLEAAYRYGVELGNPNQVLATRAGRHLGAAGRHANDRYDARAASNLLGRAVALLEPDSLERLHLLRPYDHALNETGRVVESKAVRDELYKRATALGDRGLAAHGQFPGVMHAVGVDLEEARAIAADGLEVFTELGDEEGMAIAEWRLSNVCRVQGHLAEAASWLERSLAHARGDMVTRRTVTEALAMVLCRGPVPVDDALRRAAELRAANLDDRVLDASVTRCLSELLAMAGRVDESREYGRRSSTVLEEAAVLTSSRATQGVAVSARELAGDRAGAREEAEAMWLAFRGTMGLAPDRRGLEAASLLAHVYCDDGRFVEADECLAFYRDVPDPTAVLTTALRRAAAARVAAHRGDVDEAARLAEAAVEISETSDMLNIRARVWRAMAEVESSRGAPAEPAVSTALRLYEQKGNVAAAAALRATGIARSRP